VFTPKISEAHLKNMIKLTDIKQQEETKDNTDLNKNAKHDDPNKENVNTDHLSKNSKNIDPILLNYLNIIDNADSNTIIEITQLESTKEFRRVNILNK